MDSSLLLHSLLNPQSLQPPSLNLLKKGESVHNRIVIQTFPSPSPPSPLLFFSFPIICIGKEIRENQFTNQLPLALVLSPRFTFPTKTLRTSVDFLDIFSIFYTSPVKRRIINAEGDSSIFSLNKPFLNPLV